LYCLLIMMQFGLNDPSLIKTQGFIDGKWVDAKDGGRIVVTSELESSLLINVAQKHSLRILDPATNDELGSVPEMGLAETKEAIKTAANAFKTWSTTSTKVGGSFD
jgi:succinate-semialdehyde dehydrogenase / glutarate-semialdehyde dehydrogenase